MRFNGKVYKVTCLPTGKSYIGITTRTLKRRWNAHVLRALNGDRKACSALAAAIRKYGPHQFTIEHIACAWTLAGLQSAEIDLIEQERTKSPNGYNLTAGGEGGFDPAPETREKLRASHVGKKQTPELIEKRTAPRRGKPVPRHIVEKRSASLRASGKKRKPWGKHKPDSILKMKEACKGRMPSEEAIQKSASSRTGKRLPEATKAKMRGRRATFKTRYRSRSPAQMSLF